ncbi:hypothetical protein AB0C07_38795 [Actinoplanes missouriensis]|uniref:hypothetical protein n=1 Tax=Actinoplanes missouriensis TaxID=1866 RepID=UPI0033DC2B1C
MTVQRPPRILDASALVELFAGHPELMQMLDDADAGLVLMAFPATAVLEAQAALRAEYRMWQHFFRFPGVHVLDLTAHGALDAGDIAAARLMHHPMQPVLTGPQMVGQVVTEAVGMNATVVTRIPELYGGHDVAVVAI